MDRPHDAQGLPETPSHPVRLVTLGVIALNEEAYLPGLLEDICRQDYSCRNMEIILVDGGSTDVTKGIMRAFAAAHDEFFGVRVLDNVAGSQPAGWNVVLRNMSGDAVIRVDAHASLSSDFVSQNVRVLNAGESVCGGYRPTEVPDALKTPWRETLHLAEQAAFGSSVASYRRKGEARYVDSVFHGAYRREVVEAVGLFDERLLRTEDNDYHFRVRQAGYRIRFDPAISSAQYMRSSLGGMLRQKYGNGYWVGRTLFVQPGCLSPFHLAPLAFVVGVLALVAAGAFASWVPFVACAAVYGAACVLLSARAVVQSRERRLSMLALPLVFFGVHVSYGWGSVVGTLGALARKVAGSKDKESGR